LNWRSKCYPPKNAVVFASPTAAEQKHARPLAMAASGKEISLAEAPTDGISSVRFSPHGALLVAASWDTYTRIYDTAANCVKAKYQHKV